MRSVIRLCVPVVLMMQMACTNLIFQPTREHQLTPAELNIEYHDIYVTAHDGVVLHGWKLMPAQEKVGSVIFFHGNAENISTHFLNVYWLTDHGFEVYVFDYRGYGQSGGVPDLDATIKDIETMFGHVAEQLPNQEKMVVIGHSLGASLGIYVVAHSQYRDNMQALVAVSAFSDYKVATRDVLSMHWLTWLLQWPVSITINNSYRPLDVVEQVSPTALLIMHGEYDQIVPPYHAQALFAAAGEPKKLMLVAGDHNNFFNSVANRKLLLEYLLQELPAPSN